MDYKIPNQADFQSNIKRKLNVWGSRPSGLSYGDMIVSLYLGKHAESKSKIIKKPSYILDLGTFFGHSAFMTLQGASLINKSPSLNIHSIDIFSQPLGVLQRSNVKQFINQFGGVDIAPIKKGLEEILNEEKLPSENILLIKKDINDFSIEDFVSIAPYGYSGVLIDCGKSPELINTIINLLNNNNVTNKGTILYFQDFFDFHCPWNLYALFKMIENNNVKIKCLGSRLSGPIVEVINHNHLDTICDEIVQSSLAGWHTTFTHYKNEYKALEYFMSLFDKCGYKDLSKKIECMKVGSLLRADRMNQAEKLLNKIDKEWPTFLDDSLLQQAYRRYMHSKTGEKNLDIVLNTDSFNRRQYKIDQLMRSLWDTYTRYTNMRISKFRNEL